MNIVLGSNTEASTLTAAEICYIVHHLPTVVDIIVDAPSAVSVEWHRRFDTSKWLLLPDTVVLEEVRDFVEGVTSARKNSCSEILTFHSKVRS